MGQLQRVPVTITGFVFVEVGETIDELKERFENATVVNIDFNDMNDTIELEHATINEQE